MNRRDIIIVAVLINAGLLVTLFASSLKRDQTTDFATAPNGSQQIERDAASPSPKQSGDQIDQVISQYTSMAKAEEKKLAKKKAQEAEAQRAMAEAAAASKPKAASEMNPEEKEKRAKAIKKKLKSIAELKEKGGDLDEAQQKKLASEGDLVKELESLGI